MIIVWSPEAIEDMASLYAYIVEDNPAAAQRVLLGIIRNIETLAEHPNMGRPGRVAGTRELVVPRTPYIVPYRVRDNRVQVLRVYHAALRWPESF
jgi:toxin ParE1/3/4